MRDAEYHPAAPAIDLTARRAAQRQADQVARFRELATFSQPDFQIDPDDIGFNAVLLTQASLPHRDPKTSTWVRENGKLRLAILADPEIGIPWGSLPRLILVWLVTEVVHTKERRVLLGDTLSEFMRELGILRPGARPTGGRWGSIPRLRTQLVKLFAASISCNTLQRAGARGAKIDVASDYSLWWDWKPGQADQAALFPSYVTLGEHFHREILDHHYPVHMPALQLVKRSPLAIDLYCWLTYRMSYLPRETTVPWRGLSKQFGASYSQLRQFKAAVVDVLPLLRTIYPDARIKDTPDGLVLRPSPPHVRRLAQ